MSYRRKRKTRIVVKPKRRRKKYWLKIMSMTRIVIDIVETSVSVTTVFVTQCLNNNFEKIINNSLWGCIILI